MDQDSLTFLHRSYPLGNSLLELISHPLQTSSLVNYLLVKDLPASSHLADPLLVVHLHRCLPYRNKVHHPRSRELYLHPIQVSCLHQVRLQLSSLRAPNRCKALQ